MVSSLEAHLKNAAPIDRNALNRTAASYLYTKKEAAGITLDDVHSAAKTAFQNLVDEEIRFEKFFDRFFSDSAKEYDRTLHVKSENEALDADISDFLPLLAPRFLSVDCGRILEWLIRRFRFV